jgi:diguanylate cyclase (GGDEF)-like protein
VNVPSPEAATSASAAAPTTATAWLVRVRLAHSALAVALVFAGIVAMHVGAALGAIDRRGLTLWTVTSAACFTIVYLLVRSGFTARFRDPSLTFVQIGLAAITGAWAYTLAGTAHPVVTLMLSLALSFGSFGISPRQLFWCAGFSLVVFGAVMIRQCLVDPLRYRAVDDFLLFVFLVLIVAGQGINTIRVNGMRQRLRDQRAALSDAVAAMNELAVRDPLTGLHNRRYMLEVLRHEQARAVRAATPCAIALLDIDHFKSLNDSFGHACGDQALIGFSSLLTGSVRASDVVGRWGGEEFVVLFPATALGGALEVVERVRAALASGSSHELPRRLTFSAGVAAWDARQSIEQNIARADAACYAAKRLGRDRTEVAAAAQAHDALGQPGGGERPVARA